MFSHVQTMVLSPQGLELTWEMWSGPILAPAVWSLADQNQDELVSDQEAEAYVGQLLTKLSARLGEKGLVWEVVGIDWPASSQQWQLGDEPIRVELRAAWPAGLQQGQRLALANEFEASNSLNWFYVKASEGVRFETPTQEKGLLTLQVALEGVAGAAAGHDKSWLDSWESGRPTLPAADQVGLALFDDGEAQEGGILGILTGLVRSSESSPNFYLLALTIALVVGALHALTPGHGKTIAAAYLVGTRGTIKHAITLGAVVTLTHTGSVFILGLLTLVASQYILPTTLFPLLEVASGGLIIVLALSLLYQRWQSWRHDKQEHGHEHHHGHKHEHGHHDHDHHHPHADDPNLERIYHEHGDGMSHYHLLPKANHGVSWSSLIMLGISGGLVPCPEAIGILLIAVTINRIVLGLSLIISFSLGLALVLIAIGIFMVRSRKLMERLTIFERMEKLAPLVSALVLLFLGLVVTLEAAAAFRGSEMSSFSTLADTSALVPFELDDASLLYMGTDEMNRFHLFSLRLDSQEPFQLDSAPLGLLSYALSPDGEEIVVVALREGGGTDFRLIKRDGSQ
jgi:ABC-type nickel/cobalt efflux system permease component RcnA